MNVIKYTEWYTSNSLNGKFYVTCVLPYLKKQRIKKILKIREVGELVNQ